MPKVCAEIALKREQQVHGALNAMALASQAKTAPIKLIAFGIMQSFAGLLHLPAIGLKGGLAVDGLGSEFGAGRLTVLAVVHTVGP